MTMLMNFVEAGIKNVKPLWSILIILAVAFVCIWQLSVLTFDAGISDLRQTAGERLALYDSSLQSVLTRMENLPYVMAHNDAVARLLVHYDNLDQLNRDLESLNYWAGTASLYIMNADGDVVASSTWREPINLIGKNYAFRPYFSAAMSGKQGHYFAIGLQTNEPGLYMSHGISREGKSLGAVVVKADLNPLLGDWREGRENVFITDDNGVIILSSHDEWLFKVVTDLTPERKEALLGSRQYSKEALGKASFVFKEDFGEKGRVVEFKGRSFLLITHKNQYLNWELSYLAPLKQVQQNVQAVIAIGAILTLLIMALGMYLRERRQKRQSRKKLKEAETIKEINLRLKDEIEEHYRTEQALRDAQAELVQTSKLAALGQMAAGVVHELNQPIAAIRTHAASSRLLLDRGQPEQLRETLEAVSRITGHMSEITAQLKTFAYKAPKQDESVCVQASLDAALAIVSNLLKEHRVSVTRNVPVTSVAIQGSRAQLEQVLVNLFRNSIDAMAGSDEKILEVNLSVENEMLVLKVIDTGQGIPEEDLGELFTPFFTTKEVGKGLGLGLSICYRIINDLGGMIRGLNKPEGHGAIFIVSLPIAEREMGIRDD